MLFSLKLISGELIQHHVQTDVVTIGRSKNCTIVAPYEGISRNHCQVNFENGEIFITDLGSTNGVFIDGTRIEPNVKIPYQTFITFSIGSIQSITIEFDDKTAIKSHVTTNSSANQSKDSDLTATKAFTSEAQKMNMEIALKLKTSPGPKEALPSRSNLKIPKKNKAQEKSPFANPIIILLLIGAVVWYFTQDEDTDQLEDAETVHSSKSSKKSEKNFEQY